jgi:hypothetical protein
MWEHALGIRLCHCLPVGVCYLPLSGTVSTRHNYGNLVIMVILYYMPLCLVLTVPDITASNIHLQEDNGIT